MTATRVAALSALEPDSAIRVEIGGVAIAVVLDSNGVVHAIGDTCTHGDISLADGFVEGETLECWAHGSAFSLCTGKPLNLPAYEPVPVYEVVIDGDDVLIDPAVTKDLS
ncbi:MULTISPECIES: non-heme iron oxygenase ferredoxin subunit [Microbacterium]|jgi:3-phenylpropionate/trans-cinnamate dioxygenase ferredoxin subunit|uniref:non-heme iron oxygenase ferredoxin subunit n=2 Tax=Microbacteriaceae TaxID=85023 RepID=UPI0006F3713E|nr:MULTISPECIES: non-heme iron oxygenase ferredoxin subunit [unclassified Microbacterium]KQS05399.1 non-heme iron oxygenase ferredoxin subunit [Microbacterium sp. Leaf347]MBN9197543.1 non-heme iron oxygenase ferredoxin subunit [Microbacterium ginsengisoli]MCK9914270.1 non-heme iron oxygenase ferredoxin subunit [Microbacteriaceae bacterium K1510]OJU77433.1 MAG: non-heme iron oxygenase ferredoxin subunit [Microbacterium sp. 71-23]